MLSPVVSPFTFQELRRKWPRKKRDGNSVRNAWATCCVWYWRDHRHNTKCRTFVVGKICGVLCSIPEKNMLNRHPCGKTGSIASYLVALRLLYKSSRGSWDMEQQWNSPLSRTRKRILSKKWNTKKYKILQTNTIQTKKTRDLKLKLAFSGVKSKGFAEKKIQSSTFRGQVACEIGRFSGLSCSLQLASSSRQHGGALRKSMALLRQVGRWPLGKKRLGLVVLI